MARRPRAGISAASIVAVLALGVGVFVVNNLHRGPDAAQSTPYWSAWNSWQKSAKPVVAKLDNDLASFSFDLAHLATNSTNVTAEKVATDVTSISLDVAAVARLSTCPDHAISVRLRTFAISVHNFEELFVADVKNANNVKKDTFAILARHLTALANQAQGIDRLWNAEVNRYNAL